MAHYLVLNHLEDDEAAATAEAPVAAGVAYLSPNFQLTQVDFDAFDIAPDLQRSPPRALPRCPVRLQ